MRGEIRGYRTGSTNILFCQNSSFIPLSLCSFLFPFSLFPLFLFPFLTLYLLICLCVSLSLSPSHCVSFCFFFLSSFLSLSLSLIQAKALELGECHSCQNCTTFQSPGRGTLGAITGTFIRNFLFQCLSVCGDHLETSNVTQTHSSFQTAAQY